MYTYKQKYARVVHIIFVNPISSHHTTQLMRSYKIPVSLTYKSITVIRWSKLLGKQFVVGICSAIFMDFLKSNIIIQHLSTMFTARLRDC